MVLVGGLLVEKYFRVQLLKNIWSKLEDLDQTEPKVSQTIIMNILLFLE